MPIGADRAESKETNSRWSQSLLLEEPEPIIDGDNYIETKEVTADSQ